MKALRTYVLAYPVVLPLAFLTTWLAGRLSLGHWPRPSLDDPKYIGAWVDVPYHITAFLLVVGFPAFVVALLGLIYVAFRDRLRRKQLLFVLSLSVVCMVATVLYLRWDPMGVVNWYLD